MTDPDTREIWDGICVLRGSPFCFCKLLRKVAGPPDIEIMPGDTVTVVVDPDDAVAELDESNNTYTTTFFLPPECDLGVVGINLNETGPNTYAITPVIEAGGGGVGVVPVDFDVYVNGAWRAGVRDVEIVPLVPCVPPVVPCSYDCLALVIIGGTTNVVRGDCRPGPTPHEGECWCYFKIIKIELAQRLELAGGELVTVLIDPDGRVADVNRANNTFSTLVRPRLSVTASAGNITIRWPLSATNFLLEATSSLAPAAWTPMTYDVQIIDGYHTVTAPTTNWPGQFFRLRQHQP